MGHPWASEICAVVNLESAGSGGRELLFQVGPQNRWIAETYAKTAPKPFASSITQVLFQTGIIPGDTDYRIYRDFGKIPGADFAVIANGWVYHTSRDDFAHLDFRSIQRYGTTVAAFARGLTQRLSSGRLSGSEAEEGAVMYDVLGAFVVVYSAGFAKAVHIACTILCLSWSLGVHRGSKHMLRILAITLKLLAAVIGATFCSALCGLFLAFSPFALAGAGHPELSQLLFVPPAIAGFFLVTGWKAERTWSEAEAAAGAMSLAAFFCLFLSSSSVGILASYPFLLWAMCPLLGEAASQIVPRSIRALPAVACFILPWVIHMQLYVMTLDMFCPLTMRSGTTVPGDLIQAAVSGAIPGLCMAFSCRWLLKLPPRTLTTMLGVAFMIGMVLAAFTFPYSYDRPKRIYMQEVLGPRALISQWSFGYFAEKASGQEAMSWSGEGKLPSGLPPKRPDCDCYWVLFTEGGTDPTNGQTKAFNFTLSVKPGDLRMDIWTTHLQVQSPEIKEQQLRMPHWVNFVGFSSELQVHHIKV